MINGIVENISIRNKIEEFKDRGVFVYENSNTRFYEVSKKYDYEDNKKHVLDNYGDLNVGSKTDIFLTSRNPLPGSVTTGLVSKLIWIGHAGMVIDDEGKTTIEITGNDVNNFVSIYNNTWLEDSLDTTKEIALVRIKNIDSEKEQKILDYLQDKLDYPYNYTFIFNQKKSYYCTDLMSRSVKAAGININYDKLVTTGADILYSKNVYLVYYRERVVENDGIKFNVYYLGKEG